MSIWWLSPERVHESMARERRVLAAQWQLSNEGLSPELRLRFAYVVTPPCNVPLFIQDKACLMLEYCQRRLGLQGIRIIWLEWTHKGNPVMVLQAPIMGLALGASRKGPGFDTPADAGGLRGQWLKQAGAASAACIDQGEAGAILVRWDVGEGEVLFTLAHEAKHLWYGLNDAGQSLDEEEAACNAFAAEAIKETAETWRKEKRLFSMN